MIEFHNITEENLPALSASWLRLDLPAWAPGRTLRNITLCPGNGLCPDSVDFSATAAATRQVLESFEGVYSLPRKFKISFSGCEHFCAQPYINDLGFVAQVRDAEITVKLIGAGSLGAKPETGIELADNIRPEQIPAMALAALRIFNTHGNRENRPKARLRHIRQELGNEAFISLFKAEHAASMEHVPLGPPFCLLHQACILQPNQCAVRPLSPDQADALAEILKATHACARILNHHRIAVFAQDSAALCAALRESSELQPLLDGPDIVSCPGTTFCSQAIVNTHAAETALRAHLSADTQRPYEFPDIQTVLACYNSALLPLSGASNGMSTERLVKVFRY